MSSGAQVCSFPMGGSAQRMSLVWSASSIQRRAATGTNSSPVGVLPTALSPCMFGCTICWAVRAHGCVHRRAAHLKRSISIAFDYLRARSALSRQSDESTPRSFARRKAPQSTPQSKSFANFLTGSGCRTTLDGCGCRLSHLKTHPPRHPRRRHLVHIYIYIYSVIGRTGGYRYVRRVARVLTSNTCMFPTPKFDSHHIDCRLSTNPPGFSPHLRWDPGGLVAFR